MKRTQAAVLATALQSRYWGVPEAEVVLASWRASGLSLVGFAERHGLVVSRLDRWKARLRDRGVAVRFHRVAVVEPAVRPRSSASQSVDVVSRNGRRVRVRQGFDAAHLEAVVRAIESWPC